MAIEPSATETTDDGSYDVLRARGQEIHVDRGEVFENKVIDVSTGDDVYLRVTGTNSVIRNVGFEGLYRGDEYVLSIDAGPGDVLVENVYLGDGGAEDGSRCDHGPGAIFLHRDNEADVTFRRCNVQGFPNNGFHCSNTASGSGSVRFDSCFGKNNGVATFRCAGGGDLIDGCVAYTDTTNYGSGDDDYRETNGRPVWVWPGGTVTIRDSHFASGPYPNAIVAGANDSPGRISFESGAYRGPIQRVAGSTVDVGAEVSTDPDLSIPDGVPTTAEAAASNAPVRSPVGPTSGAGGRFPHAIVFDGRKSEEPSSYSFQATAAVAAAGHETPIGEGTVIHGRPVRGTVGDARHAYWFQGDVAALSVCGDATVSIQYDARDGAAGGDSNQ